MQFEVTEYFLWYGYAVSYFHFNLCYWPALKLLQYLLEQQKQCQKVFINYKEQSFSKNC